MSKYSKEFITDVFWQVGNQGHDPYNYIGRKSGVNLAEALEESLKTCRSIRIERL